MMRADIVMNKMIEMGEDIELLSPMLATVENQLDALRQQTRELNEAVPGVSSCFEEIMSYINQASKGLIYCAQQVEEAKKLLPVSSSAP